MGSYEDILFDVSSLCPVDLKLASTQSTVRQKVYDNAVEFVLQWSYIAGHVTSLDVTLVFHLECKYLYF